MHPKTIDITLVVKIKQNSPVDNRGNSVVHGKE